MPGAERQLPRRASLVAGRIGGRAPRRCTLRCRHGKAAAVPHTNRRPFGRRGPTRGRERNEPAQRDDGPSYRRAARLGRSPTLGCSLAEEPGNAGLGHARVSTGDRPFSRKNGNLGHVLRAIGICHNSRGRDARRERRREPLPLPCGGGARHSRCVCEASCGRRDVWHGC